MTSSNKPDGDATQPISEADLRALRDRVFGIPMSEKEWQICKVNWANPETLKWLQNLDAADEAHRRSMATAGRQKAQ